MKGTLRDFVFGSAILSMFIVFFLLVFLVDRNQGVEEPGDGATTIGAKPPIVWVVFDELALVDLLDSKGAIDSVRFANIAAFANKSTWYTNASTVHYATNWAIPSLLTGRWPQPGALPRFEDYPRNLFSLLDAHYEFNVSEPVSRLSKPTITAEDTPNDTEHSALWVEHSSRMWDTIKGDRNLAFSSFLQGFVTKPRDTLHFLHIVLPHRPAFYLPSGQQFVKTQRMTGIVEDPQTKAWIGSQAAVDKMHQRHLLQIGFVDMLWGKLAAKLEAMGLFDEALVIFVADHGISYRAGVSNRRPQESNFGDIAFVPLFIKFPRQATGAQDHSNVATIDVLPTLVDAVDLSTTWQFDGRSLIDDEAPTRASKILPTSGGDALVYDRQRYLAARQQAHDQVVQTFRLADPRATLFDFEDGIELIGRRMSTLSAKRKQCRIQSASLRRTKDLRLHDDYLAVRLNGRVHCADEVDAPLLVFVGDGIVVGTTRPFVHEGNLIFEYVLDARRLNENVPVEARVIEYVADGIRAPDPLRKPQSN